jgi:hypothetical protein
MRVIYPLVALALVAGGCSSDRQSTVETAAAQTVSIPGTSVATESPAVPVSVAAGTDPPPTTDPRLSGTQDVELSDLGISFAAPDTYTPLAPTELDAAFYDSASFRDLAARVQIDDEVFAQSLRETLAIFLFAPAEATGYVDNIAVSTAPDMSLPDEQEVRDVVAPLDATDVQVSQVEVDGVDAVVGSYTRPGTNGDLFARDVMVEAKGNLVTIGVVAGDEQTADVVSNVVVSTLRLDAK